MPQGRNEINLFTDRSWIFYWHLIPFLEKVSTLLMCILVELKFVWHPLWYCIMTWRFCMSLQYIELFSSKRFIFNTALLSLIPIPSQKLELSQLNFKFLNLCSLIQHIFYSFIVLVYIFVSVLLIAYFTIPMFKRPSHAFEKYSPTIFTLTDNIRWLCPLTMKYQTHLRWFYLMSTVQNAENVKKMLSIWCPIRAVIMYLLVHLQLWKIT